MIHFLASHEHFHSPNKISGNMETWDSESALDLSCSLLLLSFLWPLLVSVEWVQGSVWWLEEVNCILYYFLQSRPS